MTTKTTTANRWGRVTVLGALAVLSAAAGCGRGLLGISSSEKADGGGMQDASVAVPPGANVCFADHPASCDVTCREATRVLYTNCASCHSGADPLGGPPWDFLLDPAKLTTETWSRPTLGPTRFVKPGDPENSAVYDRAVILKDMPPVQLDLSQPNYPRVSAADGEILRDWIANCMGPDVFDGGTPSSSVDARGAIPSAIACPASPPSGACSVERQECQFPTKTCVCEQGNWDCIACPAQQPPGVTCAQPTSNGAYPAFHCAYGGVTCACDSQGIHQWECGACPAVRPSNGGSCGNSAFSCIYGGDACICSGNQWFCIQQECPWGADLLSSPSQCHAGFGCVYPSTGQSCGCGALGWDCSCPPSPPAEHDICLPANRTECRYGDQACTCQGLDGWHCGASCPESAPVGGSACGSSLSCTYDSGFCYCDGQHWQCR